MIENLNRRSLKKAYRRLKKDTKWFSSLLVRDPLDFLDFEVNLYFNLDSIIYEIRSDNYHPQKPYLLSSAKSKGINRPTVVFDVKDALIYRFCIEQVDDELLAKTRQKNIRGGIRITPKSTENGDDFYEKWFEDWMEHLKSIQDSLKRKKYLASTDIASYFENINILLVKDLIRSDVQEKKGVLNLLFYFLEHAKFREEYEVNTFNGLPQEDMNCSRILAYYFLKPVDDAMAEFCKRHDAEYYRFVDDMSIVVNSEVIGKKALKHLTESLRKLNLVSSIEKTSIDESVKVELELFFQENDTLSFFEEGILTKLKRGKSVKSEVLKLKKYYKELLKLEKDKYKNWIKILKRFYTLCSYSKADFLLSELASHIVRYPPLFSGIRIAKYLVRMQKSKEFEEALNSLIDYLYSEENLYPDIECNLIEAFLLIKPNNISEVLKKRLKKLGDDVFFRKSNYEPLTDYARALSCLLIHRFDKENISNICKHYLNDSEKDNLLKKYMIIVSLTINNYYFRQNVLDKAKKEQNISINRLINFIEGIDKNKHSNCVINFLKRGKIYYFKKDREFEIVEDYIPIRGEILKDLIQIYSRDTDYLKRKKTRKKHSVKSGSSVTTTSEATNK